MSKTTQWAKIRKELKKEFEAKGITKCEMGLPGCWRDNGLSFAHLDKRRYLKEEDLKEVVLTCISCHQFVEYKGRPIMRSMLTKAIKRRIDYSI